MEEFISSPQPNYEFNVAYSNAIDFTSTVFDNDGADSFFGVNLGKQMDFHIKQEVMSPAVLETTSPEAETDSSSEYSTPCSRISQSRSHKDTPLPMRMEFLNESDDNEKTHVAEECDEVNELHTGMKGLCLSSVKKVPSHKSVKFEGLELTLPREKDHPMETRLDVVVKTPSTVIELRTRSVTRQSTRDETDRVRFEPKQLILDPDTEPKSDIPAGPEAGISGMPKAGIPDMPKTGIPDVPEAVAGPSFVDNILSEPFDKPNKKKPMPGPSNVRNVASGRKPVTVLPNKPALLLPTKPTLVLPNKPGTVKPNNAGVVKRKWQASPSEIPQRVKFTSMAETLHKFHYGTPERFRRSKAGEVARQTMHSLRSTIPISPAFQTKLRARPYHAPTQEELQEAEDKKMEEIRNAAKALPLNPVVFKTPRLGKRVEKKPTVAAPFKLTVVEPKAKVATSRFTFTAQPMPRAIINGPTGLKERAEPKVTEPITPSFMKRYGSAKKQVRVEGIDEKNKESVIVSKEVYHFGIFTGDRKKAGFRRAIVQPFSFDQRQKLLDQKKAEQIQKVLDAEKKAREFHANPLPRSLGGSASSLKENATAAVPVMSHLLDDHYAERRKERIRKELEKEEAELKKSRMFKAQPMSKAKPFIPVLQEHTLQEIPPLNLNTERRAKQWDVYAKEAKCREEANDKVRKERELEKEKAQKQELLKLRRDIVHKARPVLNSQPLVIQPSDKPLTTPRTPFARSSKKENTPHK